MDRKKKLKTKIDEKMRVAYRNQKVTVREGDFDDWQVAVGGSAVDFFNSKREATRYANQLRKRMGRK
jgi:hypothetical protein